MCFFFSDSATPQTSTSGHTLSLHVALPIFGQRRRRLLRLLGLLGGARGLRRGSGLRLGFRHGRRFFGRLLGGQLIRALGGGERGLERVEDRKSTRLNSSH